ncbi:hypothetical protein [Nostoc sp.]|uniref:hypothetical protein n=1 Tax=Nostoc sp. TaxID=1180 RepID=UPI002FFD3910
MEAFKINPRGLRLDSRFSLTYASRSQGFLQVEQLAWKPPRRSLQDQGVALQALKRGATAVFPTPRKRLVRLLLVRMLREQTF